MIKKTITVTKAHGLHARPAAEFVKLASTFDSEITVNFNGESSDAKSIMGIMALGISKDNEVEINIEGNDQDQAFSALKTFMTTDE